MPEARSTRGRASCGAKENDLELFQMRSKSFAPPRPLARSRTNSFKGPLNHSLHPGPYLPAGPILSKAM